MNSKTIECLLCGEQETLALSKVVLCREHLCMLRGISPVENHHPEGQANSPETITIPANVHAVLTALQNQWSEILRYPSNDPAVQIARRLKVLQDFIRYLSKAIQHDSDFLLALALGQQEINGPEWWNLGQVAPLPSLEGQP